MTFDGAAKGHSCMTPPTPPASAAKPETLIVHLREDAHDNVWRGWPVMAQTQRDAADCLSALRARVADLEMMLRVRLRQPESRYDIIGRIGGYEFLIKGGGNTPAFVMALADDSTGLPILTDAARADLAREGERRGS